MFKNVSPDLVWSGKFGCPVLSGQETHMPSAVEPYQGSKGIFFSTSQKYPTFEGVVFSYLHSQKERVAL